MTTLTELQALTDCPEIFDRRHDWILTPVPARWVNGKRVEKAAWRAECGWCGRAEAVSN